MCGRFALRQDAASVAAQLQANNRCPDGGGNLDARPSQTLPVLISHAGERRLGPLAWGWRRDWAKRDLINARIEDAAAKPTFADAVARRRCLVPAHGWYEWQPERRQCYRIAPADGRLLCFAGIWEWDGEAEARQARFCICTTEADGELAAIHGRKPVCCTDGGTAWLDGPDPGPVLGATELVATAVDMPGANAWAEDP